MKKDNLFMKKYIVILKKYDEYLKKYIECLKKYIESLKKDFDYMINQDEGLKKIGGGLEDWRGDMFFWLEPKEPKIQGCVTFG